MARKPRRSADAQLPVRQLSVIVAEIIAISDDPDLDASDKRVRIEARKWALTQLGGKGDGTDGDAGDGAPALPEGLRVHFIRARRQDD